MILLKESQIKIFSQLPRHRNEGSSGFTLIELLTVIAIIATLAAIAIPVYSNQIEKAKITKVVMEILMLDKEINLYRLDNNDLPNTLADIGWGGLLDPWGNPYQFANHANIPPGKRRKFKKTVPLNTDYDLYSMGPDGKTKAPITAKASYDDIIRASDGGYVGPVSEY